MKIKKILISGSTGFLGFKILNFLLKKNFFITDTVRKNNHHLIALKKKFKKQYKSLKIDHKLETKLKKNKFDCFINLATLYKKNYSVNDLNNLINSNIEFPFSILKSIYHKRLVFINFGSMMEFDKTKRSPKNIYASSKIFFEDISRIFDIKNQYNIKLFETFDLKDKRDKIIPKILQSSKNNEILNIFEKKLKLNFVTVENIIDALIKILNKKIQPGNYVIQNKNFINVVNLIKKINTYKKTKIKFKIKIKNTKKKKYNLKKIIYNFDINKKLKEHFND